MSRLSTLTLISILSMLTSMAIQLVIAAQLGVGAERDALFVAMSVPLFVNTLLVSTVGVVITPVIVSQRSPVAQRSLIYRIIGWVVLGAVTLAIGTYVARGFFVRILAPGFVEANQVRTAQLLTMAVVMLPIQAVTTVLGGFVIAQGRVLLPTASLVSGSVVTFALVLFAGSTLSASLAILATLVGASLTMLMQISVFWKRLATAGVAEVANLHGPTVATFYKQTAPLLISGVVSRSVPLVERNLASSMGVGTISCLGYAGYLMSFLVNATTAPTATASFARMCSLWNDGNREEVGALLEKNLKAVMSMALCAAGAFFLLAPEFARILPKISRFSVADAQELIDYCRILMASYCLLACGGLLSRLFYVAGASVRMAILDCFTTVFYLVAAICLGRYFGGYGLTVAIGFQSALVVGLFVHWARNQFVAHLRRDFYGAMGGILFKWTVVLGASLLAQRAVVIFTSTEAATALAFLMYLVGVVWILFPVIRFQFSRASE